MTDTKVISGLRLIGGTRLSLNNSNPREHAITVNGAQLSYNDIALGALQITDNKVYSLDEEDGQYYQILNTNSEIECMRWVELMKPKAYNFKLSLIHI